MQDILQNMEKKSTPKKQMEAPGFTAVDFSEIFRNPGVVSCSLKKFEVIKKYGFDRKKADNPNANS